jgi:dolichyl-phosphate-mannose-protein mannosyltransferase
MAKIKTNQYRNFLVLILFFAFLIRFYNLWHPQAYIFDEVYHGFTAQEMAKGNIKAWEWWNAPPEGFAFEWTHPPLAKLIMASSILLWGQNHHRAQFAFRLPAVFFGTGVVFLTYLLAKTLFKNKKIALMAAFFSSVDGLFLTMSRIGMADIYFLFFSLLTILLALKGKHFYAAVSLGLAIATKWTGIYLIPVVGVILLAKTILMLKATKIPIVKLLYCYIVRWLITFIIIPLLVYLLTYLPFFTSGHSWAQFTELQKQMWWYHTNLKATHQYQSAAYTWPLMLRPVWFWVDYQKNKIANIYNSGNPWLWWTGVLILPLAIFQAVENLKQKGNFSLILTLFAYFIFWTPWIFSPRIMFLHHYLPSLPFLFILIAWALDKIKKPLITNCYLLITLILFLFFYPINTGLALPQNWLKYWFWLASWK